MTVALSIGLSVLHVLRLDPRRHDQAATRSQHVHIHEECRELLLQHRGRGDYLGGLGLDRLVYVLYVSDCEKGHCVM